MDRSLKERLVGATILVVLIVLIVPELLSGPKRPTPTLGSSPRSAAEPVRNVIMDLATRKAVAPQPGAGSANSSGVAATVEDARRDGGDAVHESAAAPESIEPQATSGRRAAPPTITTLQAQHPAAAPVEQTIPPSRFAAAAPRPTAPPPASVHRSWNVQLGSFAGRANAQKLELKLRGRGYPAQLSWSGSGKALRYRVRVGPLADRAGAVKMIARLRKDGHAARIVAP